MAKLTWDVNEDRLYETGVDHGVLYVVDETKQTENKYGTGVVWNGLTSVSENPSGAEPTALWADNIKYLNLMSAEDFACTIEAYTYPDKFMECDGSAEYGENTGVYIRQQKRKMFGFCYRTRIGNAVDGDDHGYKIHIVYGCLASPSERSYATVNDSPEAITFSWEVNTTPVDIPDVIVGGVGGTVKKFRPTAYLEVDSTKIDPEKLTKLENKLYGVDADSEHSITASDPELPLPNEILALIA